MKIQSGNSENTYDLLKLGLKASNVRAKTISNNMANINTKNYKRFGVVFEENLKNDSDSSFKLRTTNDNHYTNTSSNLKRTKENHLYGDENKHIKIKQDNSTSMRSDGNNVDLEIEKVNQAANTLKYNALITSINNKFNGMKSVIK
ncbi:flagellar basal body rod protein FlgB [Clostridium butyricum]